MLLQAARLLGREAFQAEPDETTGGLRRVLEALKETEHGKAGDLSVEAVEVPLDFLDPPAEPGHIGRLGHYEILEVIGRGGMGVVLKAFDEKLHRVVAIKVMAPQLAVSAAARGRFLREARAAAAVRDEHVVTIHAVEETKGLPYLVMELLRGMSLQERIDRGGPLEPSDVLQIGMQALRGLAAAHGQGLIHRDVKPANILLENGVERVKLTDFGLARVVDDASASQHGTIAGTPHYMSPEQAAGEAIDHRTDLFSLGSVLYAMCTGRPPFCADTTIGVFKRVREDVPSPIRDINPAIPEWLVALIAKLHAKDTTQRYQSAVELVNELSQRVADLQLPTSKDAKLEIVAAGESAVGRPQSAARGQRWGLTAAAVLFLAVGLGGLTESTGVTQVVPTVIRFVTGDGTLVVELSDHDTTVTVDTGGDLVIRGAGMHEFRLRAGSYPVRADKNGTSIPLERGEISISRGGRTLVRVTRELASRVRAIFQPRSVSSFSPRTLCNYSARTADGSGTAQPLSPSARMASWRPASVTTITSTYGMPRRSSSRGYCRDRSGRVGSLYSFQTAGEFCPVARTTWFGCGMSRRERKYVSSKDTRARYGVLLSRAMGSGYSPVRTTTRCAFGMAILD
jgi:serine/threonine protein kinase